MKHADWVGVLHLVANKHDLVLSDALINFADDVLAQAKKPLSTAKKTLTTQDSSFTNYTSNKEKPNDKN